VLARDGFWSGRLREGVEHGRQAVTLLEKTDERWWLGAAHWGVAFSYGFMGEFTAALEAAARADTVGDGIGDPRLRAYAAWTTGWIRAAMGEWDAGIEACRRSLEHSPDPVNTADAMSFLGYAYLGKGEIDQAIALLTRANEQWRRFRHRPMLGWFTAVLAEACLAAGRLDEARDLAAAAVALTREAAFPYGVGVAERAAGRVTRAEGRWPAAEAQCNEARRTFEAIEARHEAAATRLDLALIAHAQDDRAAAARHLGDAATVFRGSGVPFYQARLAELASQLGVPLPAERG
jgi:tetratricopeptide (TPR) repeat protein